MVDVGANDTQAMETALTPLGAMAAVIATLQVRCQRTALGTPFPSRPLLFSLVLTCALHWGARAQLIVLIVTIMAIRYTRKQPTQRPVALAEDDDEEIDA